MPQAEGETRSEYLDRLDAELVARMRADEQEAADAELALLFPDLTPVEAVPVDPRARVPKGEGKFARFRREEAERKAADAAVEAATTAEITQDEKESSSTFLQKVAAPGTSALGGREAQLNQDFESGESQRMRDNQSTDSNN